MIRWKESKTYALVSAACFAILGLYNIVNAIIARREYESAAVMLPFAFLLLVCLALAAALLLRRRPAVLAAAAAMALFDLYSLVISFGLPTLCGFLAYVALAALAALSQKENETVKKLWFLPGALLLMGNLFGWVLGGYFSMLAYAWRAMLFSLVEVGALTAAGWWIVAPDEEAKEPSAPRAVIGTADQLKACKELLDAGVITQEEFEAKKREILGA